MHYLQKVKKNDPLKKISASIIKKGNTALIDVNLKLEPGEMAFLTGHSGAGKSTLLRLIAGLDYPSQR